MTVQELINLLKQFDPQAQVIMHKDDEGNRYRNVEFAMEDEVAVVDYDDYIFLSQFENLSEAEDSYEDDLAFTSVAVIY